MIHTAELHTTEHDHHQFHLSHSSANQSAYGKIYSLLPAEAEAVGSQLYHWTPL